jgi:prepilin-type N-terminal cleavage/methylation domain-containing protein
MRQQKGFSLIELLIVVAIILIIAAIAIPNLMQSRISANQASAAASLNAIKTSEISYLNTYPTVGYAINIGNLGGGAPCTPSSATACLLDSLLSTATPGTLGKSGYVFQATGAVSGGATTNTTFAAGAAPIYVGQTGQNDYCSTDDGVLRQKQGIAGDTPVTTTAACLLFPVAQ